MLKVLYIPAARLTFDEQLAKQVLKDSKQILSKLTDVALTMPQGMISDPDQLTTFIRKNDNAYDTVIFQTITFVDGEFIQNTIDLVNAPVIVWGVHEGNFGGRLRLNSLTGVMAACNTLKFNHHPYLATVGNPTDPRIINQIKEQLGIMRLVSRLEGLQLGVVGKYPSGFYFSDANSQALHDALGVTLKQYELNDWFNEAKKITNYIEELNYAKRHVVGLLDDTETTKRFAQFTTVAKRHVKQDHLSAIAMRCWPDFFQKLGTAPCGIFSQLTEEGIPTSCETDIHGALSMLILQELTGHSSPYLGDVVNYNEDHNSIVMWHCGFAPYSLANTVTGAQAGVHPNRKIGLAMDFNLKPGRVTLLRINYTPEGYRLITCSGEALENGSKHYQGTSVEIRLDTPVKHFLRKALYEGYEPHFALAYGDVTKQVQDLGQILNLPIIDFSEKR